ncbi:DUF1707 SHOCT-like domain-containing protein [Rhodococcoides yunnanense]|uniref:DUF1707 SHOCT-like domain-containing protein n=1 Tax=Rhodococcoides yunnanense TaxID=278209 RepID=UPI00093373B4|nr:DUF1707 domain-containing protein [Rhodococcus yunnanensis]
MSYQPSTGSPASNSRISDAERDTAVEILTGHVASGRLGIDEFDTRAARAYAAVTRADLTSVFDDLPTDLPTDLPDARLTEVPEYARAPRYRELLTWASVGVVCLTIWAITPIATGAFLYPWPVWVIGPWGAMLALQRLTGVPAIMGCPGRRVYGV